LQPPKSDQSNSAVVQTSTPVTTAHPKWLRILLRIFSPLMRLPFLGGLGRTTWLILSVAALAAFLAGGFWARTTTVDAAAPPRFSWTWWTTSLEFHRELQLASLSDAEIESVAVVRMPSGTDRIFIAGRNALLAFSDDAGHTWTELNYDPLMGGFAVMGQRAPFPDAAGILAPTSQPGAGNAKVAKPATKVPPKTITPALRQQQNAAPVYQGPPQKQTAPPSTGKPPAKKPTAALSLLPSFVPSVWASEKSPPVQQSPTAANQDLVQQLRAAGTTGATGSLQPQPPPQGIPAICRADDGALVLVMSGERAAISRDFGQTWKATSLGALVEPLPGNSSFSVADFIAEKAFPSGKHASRLETGAARLRGRLGDTLLSPQMLPLPVLDPVNRARAFYRISGNAIWTINPHQLGLSANNAPGPLGSVYRYYTDAQGSRWLPAISAFPVGLRDVAFSVNGSTGYIVGAHGTILHTKNGGASWQPLTREGLHPGQTPSATTAGGSYWRLPPPWTYPLLFLFVGALAAAIVISAVPGANSLAEAADWSTSPERPSHGGVELFTVSDRPLGEDDVDNLGFRGIARGVAGFLRNPKTQLPITLAINGAWGTGKSSLMNLICGELKRAGFRPVWFNAWHHQEDENLLASLLQSVRSEAPPSPLRESGLGFRLRLGWFRFRRFYPRALAMVAIFIGLWAAESWYETDAVYLRNYFAEKSSSSAGTKPAEKPQVGAAPAQESPTSTAQSSAPATPPADSQKPDTGKGTAQNDSPGWFGILVNSLASLHEGSDDLSKKYGVPRFLSVLYLIFQILPAALQKLKAFTANPASLLHSAAPGVPEKKIEAQTSFRMRFAKEFADVTRALGEKHRLVIFVDDLDRCKPANVAEMMEAINYVTVAGECAFVLGLETEAVRAALGLSFSAMAQEVEPGTPANSSPDAAKTVAQEDSAKVERRKRAEFARRYVEKLINIEMNVPALDGQRKQALFTIAQPAAVPGDPFERARKIARVSGLLEPAAVFLLVLALGWGGGRALVRFAEWKAQDYFQDKMEKENAGWPTKSAGNCKRSSAESCSSQSCARHTASRHRKSSRRAAGRGSFTRCDVPQSPRVDCDCGFVYGRDPVAGPRAHPACKRLAGVYARAGGLGLGRRHRTVYPPVHKTISEPAALPGHAPTSATRAIARAHKTAADGEAGKRRVAEGGRQSCVGLG